MPAEVAVLKVGGDPDRDLCNESVCHQVCPWNPTMPHSAALLRPKWQDGENQERRIKKVVHFLLNYEHPPKLITSSMVE